MPLSKKLSSKYIQQIIHREEIPLRKKWLKSDTVESIFRYGYIVGGVIEEHTYLERGMDRAREILRNAEQKGEAMASGTVILAETLSGGKGRFHRDWHAPVGGLWLTLVLVNTLLPAKSALYPLAAGTACCETLRHFRVPAQIKWVNDVQVGGKKIVGILTETEISPIYKEEYILIGIGINVNNNNFPAEIAHSASSMKDVLGDDVDIKQVAVRLLTKLAWNIGLLFYEEEHFLKNQDFTENKINDFCVAPENSNEHLLLTRWQQLSDMVGRKILFGYDVQKNPLYEAIILGVNVSGALLLQLPKVNRTLENSVEILYLD